MSLSFEMKDLSSRNKESTVQSESQLIFPVKPAISHDSEIRQLQLQAQTSTSPNESENELKDYRDIHPGEEGITRNVGSLYPDAALWGVAYVSISATGAPPPDFPKNAKRKDTRRKSSFRKAAAATARFLGLSRKRPSSKADRIRKSGK